jgi:hypothetical protein
LGSVGSLEEEDEESMASGRGDPSMAVAIEAIDRGGKRGFEGEEGEGASGERRKERMGFYAGRIM